MNARNLEFLSIAAQNLFNFAGLEPVWYGFDFLDLKQRKLLYDPIDEIDILVNNAEALPGGDLFSLTIED